MLSDCRSSAGAECCDEALGKSESEEAVAAAGRKENGDARALAAGRELTLLSIN